MLNLYSTYETRVVSGQPERPFKDPADVKAFLREHVDLLRSESHGVIFLRADMSPFGYEFLALQPPGAPLQQNFLEPVQSAVRVGAAGFMLWTKKRADDLPAHVTDVSTDVLRPTVVNCVAASIVGSQLVDHFLLNGSGEALSLRSLDGNIFNPQSQVDEAIGTLRLLKSMADLRGPGGGLH